MATITGRDWQSVQDRLTAAQTRLQEFREWIGSVTGVRVRTRRTGETGQSLASAGDLPEVRVTLYGERDGVEIRYDAGEWLERPSFASWPEHIEQHYERAVQDAQRQVDRYRQQIESGTLVVSPTLEEQRVQEREQERSRKRRQVRDALTGARGIVWYYRQRYDQYKQGGHDIDLMIREQEEVAASYERELAALGD